jgi:uncharacterized protein DUF4331
MPTKRAPIVAAVLGIAAIGFHVTRSRVVDASDHNDPVRVQASGPRLPGGKVEVSPGDPAADLADIFAWHTKDSLVCILSWRTNPANPSLDPKLVYGLHIDNDADLNPGDPADIDVWVRYAASESGSWGQKVEGLPGLERAVVSAVGETTTTENGIRMVTGLFDDPFAFDLDGFFNGLSVALGNKAPASPSPLADHPFGFNAQNDSFAGTNVGAFVIEIPLELVDLNGEELHVWATSRAVPGRN